MTTNSKLQSTEDPGDDFSEPFKSDVFTVYIGAEKTPYHLHQSILRRRSAYFKSLLSFNGSETASNSVHLNSATDTVEGFDMVVAYLYHDSYTPPGYLSDAWTTHTHAAVYVLADRLMMSDLKMLALEHMARNFTRLYGTRKITQYDAMSGTWGENITPVMEVECIVQLVHIVYSNTQETTAEGIGEEAKKDEVDKSAKATNTRYTSKSSTSSDRGTPDTMRRLVARYCASIMNSFKKSPELYQLLQTYPQFAEAIILELPERSERVRENEISHLLTKRRKTSSSVSWLRHSIAVQLLPTTETVTNKPKSPEPVTNKPKSPEPVTNKPKSPEPVTKKSKPPKPVVQNSMWG